jgi:hypothetical protein
MQLDGVSRANDHMRSRFSERGDGGTTETKTNAGRSTSNKDAFTIKTK